MSRIKYPYLLKNDPAFIELSIIMSKIGYEEDTNTMKKSYRN
jgi:hypothetical protein